MEIGSEVDAVQLSKEKDISNTFPFDNCPALTDCNEMLTQKMHVRKSMCQILVHVWVLTVINFWIILKRYMRLEPMAVEVLHVHRWYVDVDCGGIWHDETVRVNWTRLLIRKRRRVCLVSSSWAYKGHLFSCLFPLPYAHSISMWRVDLHLHLCTKQITSR